ncbi:hypothetical protein Tco_1167870, partial [Tanacetum coccineum]
RYDIVNGVVEVDGVKDEAETGATDDSAKEGGHEVVVDHLLSLKQRSLVTDDVARAFEKAKMMRVETYNEMLRRHMSYSESQFDKSKRKERAREREIREKERERERAKEKEGKKEEEEGGVKLVLEENKIKRIFLNNTNYTLWALRMKKILMANEVWDLIEGTSISKETDIKKDSSASAYLFQGLPEDLQMQVG